MNRRNLLDMSQHVVGPMPKCIHALFWLNFLSEFSENFLKSVPVLEFEFE